MTKCQKDPRLGIFLKRGLFKDIKDISPVPSLFICPVFIAELKPSLLLSSLKGSNYPKELQWGAIEGKMIIVLQN